MGTKKGVTVMTDTGTVAAEFYSVSRDGDKLVVDAKAMGVMSMDMIFTLDDILGMIKMAFSWGFISYILLFPFFCIRRLFVKPEKSETQGSY